MPKKPKTSSTPGVAEAQPVAEPTGGVLRQFAWSVYLASQAGSVVVIADKYDQMADEIVGRSEGQFFHHMADTGWVSLRKTNGKSTILVARERPRNVRGYVAVIEYRGGA